MSRIRTLSVLLVVPFCLVVPLLGLAAEPPADKSPTHQEIEGQRVTKYTKIWIDDYHNYNKEVYWAYLKSLKDEKGDERYVEIRHGKVTGFYKNGNKRWEAEYRNGKREGAFTMWAENGTKTWLTHWEHGRRHGKITQWSREHGRKIYEATYNEKEKLNGEARWWDSYGELRAKGTYRDGVEWAGTFPRRVTPPGIAPSYTTIERYEGGKKVEERLSDWSP
jgi:hypothetical protein